MSAHGCDALVYAGLMRAVIAVVVVLGLTGVAGADAKKAMQLNAQGMKKYAKKDYFGAAELFEKAIKEDETLAYAHYNLASMASLNRDYPIVIRELEWCKKSTDPVAAKLFAKAKTDKDLENALMHPRVRELVAVTPLDKLTIDQVILERSGVWGQGPIACGPASATITFQKAGKFTVKAEAACNDEPIQKLKTSGTWSVKDGDLVLVPQKNKIFEVATLTGTIGPCVETDDKQGHCLWVEDGLNTRMLTRGVHSW